MLDESDGPQHLSAPGWRRLPDDRDEAMALLRRYFAAGGELLGDARDGPAPTAPEPLVSPEPEPAPSPEPDQATSALLERLRAPREPEPVAEPKPPAAEVPQVSQESEVLNQILQIFKVQRNALDEVISTIERQTEGY